MRIKAQTVVDLEDIHLNFEHNKEMAERLNRECEYILNKGILDELRKFIDVKEDEMTEYPYYTKKSIEIHAYTDEQFREIFRLMDHLYKLQGPDGREIMEQIKNKLNNN